MRILCVPNEWPLPANSGGRIDVWRRLQMLHSSGAQLGLLTWHHPDRDGMPDAADLAAVQTLCSQVHLRPILRSAAGLLRRLPHLGTLPSHAASRWAALNKPALLAWATVFNPDVILLDGLYGVAAARWLATALGKPWLYRAHNIEHRYMQQQQQRATGAVRRLGLGMNLLGLERLERRTVQQAACVLDISPSDAVYWRQQGAARVQWMPAVVDAGYTAALALAAQQPPRWDALYFGNLNTPNNVEAVRWLVKQVLPCIGQQPCRIAVAGSKPCQEVRDLVASDPRLELLADPPDMAALVGRARVLLNPVQAGSGVNLKSVEMLFSTAALVSTPAGVQGLPADAVACFVVRAQPAAFAAALLQALDGSAPTPDALRGRGLARQAFTPAGVGQVLDAALRASAQVAAGAAA